MQSTSLHDLPYLLATGPHHALRHLTACPFSRQTQEEYFFKLFTQTNIISERENVQLENEL
jgi:hypothetical protein